jgi:serine carboxypeptidase-like clade 1
MYGADSRWRSCGMHGVRYSTRDAAGSSITPTLLPRYPALAEAFRILIFSGDADACVPYTGSEEWTARLAADNGWALTAPWSPWLVDGQVAGYATAWGSPRGFAWATVLGAGHMVPETRPAPALALFHRFLGGGPLNDPAGEHGPII